MGIRKISSDDIQQNYLPTKCKVSVDMIELCGVSILQIGQKSDIFNGFITRNTSKKTISGKKYKFMTFVFDGSYAILEDNKLYQFDMGPQNNQTF